MKIYFKFMSTTVLFTLLFATFSVQANDDDDDSYSNQEKHNQEESVVSVTRDQAALLGLKVEILNAKIVNRDIKAPGELVLNADKSVDVSAVTDAIVVQRHAGLGDQVEAGQALVTLFSDQVAEAQATYLIALSEWERVKSLGRQSVGQNRFITAQSDFRASHARLKAFGLSDSAIQTVTNESNTLGEWTLVAKTPGTVLSDDFQSGQHIAAGERLMQIGDNNTLWAAVQLPASVQFESGALRSVNILVKYQRYPATFIKQAFSLDETTRTRTVRLLLDNSSAQLYPGQFVEAAFVLASTSPVVVVPESALMRSSDGDWTVFIETQPGKYRPQEIKLGQRFGDMQEIIGLEPGVRAVTQGAFYLASELAKSQFGDDD